MKKISADFYEKVFIAFFVIVVALTAGAIFSDIVPEYVFEAWVQLLFVVLPTTAGYEGFKMSKGGQNNGSKTEDKIHVDPRK